MSPCVGSLRRRQTAAPEPASAEGRRFGSLTEIMRATEPSGGGSEDPYADVRCERCGSGDREEQMLLCDRCDRGYHLFCLRPIAARVPSGPWFCSECTNRGKKKKAPISFPVTQTKKIVDFFKIQKCELAGPEDKCGTHSSSSSSLPLRQDSKKRRRRSMTLALPKKKRRRILPYVPSADPQRRLEQMGSLATALIALKIRFSNDLTYMPGMASRYANQADLEKGGMQVLAKEDKETFELCRIMYKRGECPPLVVVFDSIEGFTVNADGYIKDMTFITEYAGDVDYLKNREHDDCDSLMTLLLATDSSKSLVICPDKRGNIARFVSGINNHTQEGRKKQNLKCVRYNVDGRCRVLLVASRDISPGERLYYDYNGYEQEYPTEHFV